MGKINFPEIYTEYDYFNLTLDSEKIKLIYRIRQYSLVTNSNKVDGLRRSGVGLKIKKKMHNDEVVVAYYKPYAEKLISLKSKNKMIELLLNRAVGDEGLTLRQHIESMWNEKNAHKITSTPLMDKEAKILDTLSSYFIGGVEGEGILTQDLSRVIQNKEVASFSADRGNANVNTSSRDVEPEDYDDSGYANSWMYEKMSNKKHRRYLKHTPKRWKGSKTYRMSNLYSYDDSKNNPVFYNWSTNEWTSIKKEHHFTMDRLINPEDDFIAEWCTVDTDNEFNFDGEVWKIDKGIQFNLDTFFYFHSNQYFDKNGSYYFLSLNISDNYSYIG